MENSSQGVKMVLGGKPWDRGEVRLGRWYSAWNGAREHRENWTGSWTLLRKENEENEAMNRVWEEMK